MSEPIKKIGEIFEQQQEVRKLLEAINDKATWLSADLCRAHRLNKIIWDEVKSWRDGKSEKDPRSILFDIWMLLRDEFENK